MIANRTDLNSGDERHRSRRPMFRIVEIEDDEPTVLIPLWPVVLIGTFLLGVVVGGVAFLLGVE